MPVSKKERKDFAACLKSEGRSHGTIDKYLRVSMGSTVWLGNRELLYQHRPDPPHDRRRGARPTTGTAGIGHMASSC